MKKTSRLIVWALFCLGAALCAACVPDMAERTVTLNHTALEMKVGEEQKLELSDGGIVVLQGNPAIAGLHFIVDAVAHHFALHKYCLAFIVRVGLSQVGNGCLVQKRAVRKLVHIHMIVGLRRFLPFIGPGNTGTQQHCRQHT